ncbi:MAG: hypothetical protein EAY75_01695 [Bacteroidetes bacterium]|nr:MAG: hypothetical protein EAY75_01695 [Bacteroidota bacterium]
MGLGKLEDYIEPISSGNAVRRLGEWGSLAVCPLTMPEQPAAACTAAARQGLAAVAQGRRCLLNSY